MKTETITIDGAQGEGGGQILRSAVALSLVTARPVTVENIRAKRNKPGLMRQHLTAVRAAAEIGDAAVDGAHIGSSAIGFVPKTVRAGSYHFRVGTAGSTTLVLQTILPALMLAEAPSTIRLEGGTHNPAAPPFEFLARSLLPLLGRMGAQVSVELERSGFYPAGGGAITVKVEPARRLSPIEVIERGELRSRRVTAMISNLPEHIAKRELRSVAVALDWPGECFRTEVVDHSIGPGNLVQVEIESEHTVEVITSFGMRKLRAEDVGLRAGKQAQRYLRSQAPVGSHLADQLLVPMALSGSGRLRTLKPSLHTTTNIDVVRSFLPVSIETTEQGGDDWMIEIRSSDQHRTRKAR